MISSTGRLFHHPELRHNNKALRERKQPPQDMRDTTILIPRLVAFKTVSEITTRKCQTEHGTIQLLRLHLLHVADEKARQVPKVHSEQQAQENEVNTLHLRPADPKPPCNPPIHPRLWYVNTVR
jgi:hypothetical protein